MAIPRMDDSGTILITGASGRLGRAIATHFAGRTRVLAFDRAGPPEPPPGIETIDVDLTSDSSVRAGLRQLRERHGAKLASVLHFAAYLDFTGRPNPLYDAINVRGTARLLNGLGEAGLHADQFVYASTMVVHAPGEPGRPIREDSPIGPTMPYSKSKHAAETWLLDHHGDTRLVILRLANVYDDRASHPVLAQQIRRIYERRLDAWLLPADPIRGQSYLHKDDLLDALDRVVDRRLTLPDPSTLLLGEPGATAYDAIQRTLGRCLLGRERTTRRIPAPLARLGVQALRLWPFGEKPFVRPWMIDRANDHYELDVSRAEAVLGWSPRHTLLGTIPTIASGLAEDPEAWFRDNDLDP